MNKIKSVEAFDLAFRKLAKDYQRRYSDWVIFLDILIDKVPTNVIETMRKHLERE